jgi:hypothetical protein
VAVVRKWWRTFTCGTSLAILGLISTWVTALLSSLSTPPPNGILPRVVELKTVAGGIALLTWLLLVIVIVWIVVHHFKEARREWRDWSRRRAYLAVLMPAAATSLSFSLLAWFSLSEIILPWVVLLVAYGLVWLVLDIEGCAHSAWDPAIPSDVPVWRGPVSILLVGFALLVLLACGVLVDDVQDVRTTGPSTVVSSTTTSSTTTSTSTTTTAPEPVARECKHAPGEGAGPATAKMAAASPPASANRNIWGCLRPTVANKDGSYVQEFDSSSSFLIGSELGAGIAGDVYADGLRGVAPNELSNRELGGQLLNRINCADHKADFQAIVGSKGEILRLFGRARKARRTADGTTLYFKPVEVAPRLLATLHRYIHRYGRALSPDGPPQVAGSHLSQVFVDPTGDLTDKILLEASAEPSPPEFTAVLLFQVCNPGASDVPEYLKVP